MANNTNGKPVAEIRVGRITATIWQNTPTDEGVFYSVHITRLFRRGSNWDRTPAFGRDDLLTVAKVADLARVWPRRPGWRAGCRRPCGPRGCVGDDDVAWLQVVQGLFEKRFRGSADNRLAGTVARHGGPTRIVAEMSRMSAMRRRNSRVLDTLPERRVRLHSGDVGHTLSYCGRASYPGRVGWSGRSEDYADPC